MANIRYRFLLSIHEQISKYLAFSKPQVLFKITCTASSPEASFCSWNCGVHFQHHIGTLRASHVRWRNIGPYPKPNLSKSSTVGDQVVSYFYLQSSLAISFQILLFLWMSRVLEDRKGPVGKFFGLTGFGFNRFPCMEYVLNEGCSLAVLEHHWKTCVLIRPCFFLSLFEIISKGNLRQAACG